jgi:hypothetical protein
MKLCFLFLENFFVDNFSKISIYQSWNFNVGCFSLVFFCEVMGPQIFPPFFEDVSNQQNKKTKSSLARAAKAWKKYEVLNK